MLGQKKEPAETPVIEQDREGLDWFDLVAMRASQTPQTKNSKITGIFGYPEMSALSLSILPGLNEDPNPPEEEFSGTGHA